MSTERDEKAVEATPTAEPPGRDESACQDVAPSQGGALRQLHRHGLLRMTRGSLIVACLTLVLGLALVAQVRTTASEGLEGLRTAELVQLLDDVTNRADSLEAEILQLEADRARLTGAQGDQAAIEAAQARLDSYQVLAGTVPVTGPGITMVVQDPDRTMTSEMLLDLVQELRDAGAEAIQINTVRVVASSWFGLSGTGYLTVSGLAVVPPYRVVAIGDPHTLTGAMAIPGGFNDTVRRVGGSVETVPAESLVIDALHHPTEPRYARPVPSADN